MYLYTTDTQTQRALQKPTTANKTEIKEMISADVGKGTKNTVNEKKQQ